MRYPLLPYVASHRACLKVDSDVARAHRKEEKWSQDPPFSSTVHLDASSYPAKVPSYFVPNL